MNKKMRITLSKLLVFVMIIQMSIPITASAAEKPARGTVSEYGYSDEEEALTADDEKTVVIENNAVHLNAAATTVETKEIEFTIKNVETGKLIKTYEEENTPLTVDGENGEAGTVFKAISFTDFQNGDLGTYQVASFISRDYNKGIKSSTWVGDDNYDAVVKVHGDAGIGGWESIVIVPNGDGTVSFKDSRFKKYITINGQNQLEGRLIDDYTKENLTNKEKFIIQTDAKPTEINDLSVISTSRTTETLELTWTRSKSIYTGLQLFMKGPNDPEYRKIADLSDEDTYQVTGLQAGTQYSFRLLVINGNGNPNDTSISTYSNETTAVTRAGQKPATPTNLHIQESGSGKYRISWDPAENAKQYRVQRAASMFGNYEDIGTVSENFMEIDLPGNPYDNFFHIVAINDAEESEVSTYISLEKELFGDHTIIFSPSDDTAKIDELIETLFHKQNDASTDAQFNGEQWQIYFKPGDYTNTACMNLGFYTSFNGLGKTPYDVKLNNIAIPDYLGGNNATCNFWRSAENLSIINTGNAQGNAQYGSWRGDWFNWAVAQAAPLRRVYSERPVAYDWNYGWASGGYVADSYLVGKDVEGNGAGTWSGQQFYTRNTRIEGNAFGTTLNNFFQGVEAPNLPNEAGVAAGTSRALMKGNGYSNWKIPGENGAQQVFTNVETTPKIAEKPFLYLDDNKEYQVFVPSLRKDTKGISWSRDNMGEGTSLPLSTFYVAKPSDTAAVINEQLAAGKNIYFTPGTYHVEVPIRVNRKDTVLLGTGMASIIPDNDESAMEIADVDGVRIAGLIFDAGEYSKDLLIVGEKGSHNDHSDNPIILQDLFFRVGGTTNKLTKADDALEINADDTIGDHFWIWRADHGAGVKWYGNVSKHGLIVNGNDVTCYALFNEHFQEYHTLWNGDNGATYFYQNETCYDPISQEAWMSHDGTVNGYASYKVADNVENHYAVGLGVYNVFIFTGPTYDSSEVQIALDNAIEVPDKDGVLIENACLQTFADEEKVLQEIRSVVNGQGDPVSSGTDSVTGEPGTKWDRTFLLYYCNGKAEGSSREVKKLYEDLRDFYENHKNDNRPANKSDEEWAAFQNALNKAKEKTDGDVPSSVSWPIESTKAEYSEVLNTLIDFVATDDQIQTAKASLSDAIKNAETLSGNDYTDTSWEAFRKALDDAKNLVAQNENSEYSKYVSALDALQKAKKALVVKGNEMAVARASLSNAITAAGQFQKSDYTEESWADFAQALSVAEALNENGNATVNEITAATSTLIDAQNALVYATGNPSDNDNPDNGANQEPDNNTNQESGNNGSQGSDNNDSQGVNNDTDNNANQSVNNGTNNGQNQNPDNNGNQNANNGSSQFPDNGGNQSADNGQNQNPDNNGSQNTNNGSSQFPDNGGNQGINNGQNQNPDNNSSQNANNSSSQFPDNGGNQGINNGQNQNPDNNGSQNANNGSSQFPDNGGNQGINNGQNQNPDNGQNQSPDNNSSQNANNGSSQFPDNGGNQGINNGQNQNPDNGQNQSPDNNGSQNINNGSSQFPDNVGNQSTDNSENQGINNGQNQNPNNGENQTTNNGENQMIDNDGNQTASNGENQVVDNNENQTANNGENQVIDNGGNQNANNGGNQVENPGNISSGTMNSETEKNTSSVKLNATSIPLQVGKSTTALKIKKKKPGNDKVVKWTSSNKKIVTVTKKGKIKAKKVGTAYVTVTMKSGATAKCKVKVQKKKVTTKKLTTDAKKVTVKIKKKVQLNVARNPITATEKITWTSSDQNVATVTNKGKVTGKKAGKATITAATTNGKKIKFTVTVKK